MAGEQAYNVQVKPSIEKKQNASAHTHTRTNAFVIVCTLFFIYIFTYIQYVSDLHTL